jgi:hypothetical protein
MPLGANKAALFGVAGVSTGTSILLATGIASASASLAFTIPATYKQIVFGFYNIAPATDNVKFGFQGNVDGQSGFNETITSTAFNTYHSEDDASTNLSYQAVDDQAQGTGYQNISWELGNAADECSVGELHLFSPSSTTYVKQFYATTQMYNYHNLSREAFVAGYFNVTGAIDEISFKMTSGNIASGTIKMWGVL